MTSFILLSAVIIIGWFFILLPSIIYLLTTWKLRKKKLFARLDEKSIQLYYKQFYPNEIDTEGKMKSDFKVHFKKLYGTHHYIFPLIFLGVLSGIGLLATLFSASKWMDIYPSSISFPPIVISAFLGAYAWVLGDQLVRYQNSDFTYYDIYNAIYRFLIAIPLGISLASFIKDDVAVPFVFLLAAFPIKTLLKFSRRLVSQKFGLGEDESETGQLELQQLQAIGRTNAERFQEEGISTVAQLAWADPIDLMIKTNKDFSFVIDLVSQSLLWIYFEKNTPLLYKYSLRGAQEVCSFLDDLDSEELKTKVAAVQTRDSCAKILSMTPETFVLTLLIVRDDPYAQFLFNIWD